MGFSLDGADPNARLPCQPTAAKARSNRLPLRLQHVGRGLPAARRVITPGHRRSLNRALHELRRPLQALALLEDPPAPSGRVPSAAGRRGLLELVTTALEDLDRAVNGGEERMMEARRFSCRELALCCVERWRHAAAGA